jgi:carboxyl-terminal processing protease
MRIMADHKLRRFQPLVVFGILFGLTFSVVPASAAEEPPAEASAELQGPSQTDRVVAQLVGALLPRRHISGDKLNDELSQRALRLYLKTLDPLKLYFYQSDFEGFSKYETELDDLVRRGDISVAYTIFDRFLDRVKERVATANELLDQDFDFTRDESIVIDPDAARYALDADEARDRWRRQIKFNLLDLKDEETSGKEAREQLRRRYNRTARRWEQIDSDDLLELFLSSVTTSYDPHTTYLSPGSLDDFQIMMRLNLEGIGAALREKDGYTVVTNVIPGGAADKHGKLQENDQIVSVGQGEEGEMVDIIEMPLKQVVQLIRGQAGTTVRLGVRPKGVGEAQTYKIERARVELEDSAARGDVIEHQAPGDNAPTKIGYINLPSFYMDMDGARNNERNYRSSTRDVRNILEGFKEKGVDSVVLDLSKNGGGSLTEAINLTGLFIDQGPVVQVKNSDGTVQAYPDEEAGVAWDGPLVVMTSQFSASASEILAGAIQDYRRGLIVGDPKTHGKGTVQTLMDLGRELFGNNRNNYGALKVTLQQFYLPDGDSTQKEGVAADVILPSLSTHMDVGEDDLEYALEHDRVPKTDHRVYNMVPADVLGVIRAKTKERVATNEEFLDLQRRIDSYQRQKKAKFISLNEEEFVARRKELDAQQAEEDQAIDQQTPDDEVYRDYFYNNEVLNIGSDYTEGLRQQNLAQAG